ncbi:MAG: hypothetical protein ABL907_12855 [Hyphomicrobium sp.]
MRFAEKSLLVLACSVLATPPAQAFRLILDGDKPIISVLSILVFVGFIWLAILRQKSRSRIARVGKRGSFTIVATFAMLFVGASLLAWGAYEVYTLRDLEVNGNTAKARLSSPEYSSNWASRFTATISWTDSSGMGYQRPNHPIPDAEMQKRLVQRTGAAGSFLGSGAVGLSRTHVLADPYIDIRYTMPVGNSRISVLTEPDGSIGKTTGGIAIVAALALLGAALMIFLVARVPQSPSGPGRLA